LVAEHISRRDSQNLAYLPQPARRNGIFPFLVFLYLLECHSNGIAEFRLAQPTSDAEPPKVTGDGLIVALRPSFRAPFAAVLDFFALPICAVTPVCRHSMQCALALLHSDIHRIKQQRFLNGRDNVTVAYQQVEIAAMAAAMSGYARARLGTDQRVAAAPHGSLNLGSSEAAALRVDKGHNSRAPTPGRRGPAQWGAFDEFPHIRECRQDRKSTKVSLCQPGYLAAHHQIDPKIQGTKLPGSRKCAREGAG
jgi:hypothetical protein